MGLPKCKSQWSFGVVVTAEYHAVNQDVTGIEHELADTSVDDCSDVLDKAMDGLRGKVDVQLCGRVDIVAAVLLTPCMYIPRSLWVMRMRSWLDRVHGSIGGGMLTTGDCASVEDLEDLVAGMESWISFGRCSGSLQSQQALIVVGICGICGTARRCGKRCCGAVKLKPRWLQCKPDTACVDMDGYICGKTNAYILPKHPAFSPNNIAYACFMKGTGC